jgi:cytidine deaminase
MDMPMQRDTQPRPQGLHDEINNPSNNTGASSAVTDEQKKTLVAAAQRARQYAYAPYSAYLVGAALLTTTGEIYIGCNIENAAYPATICAERVALVKAVSEGVRTFKAIAVVTDNGGFPCGTCRQMLYEFAPDLSIIVTDGNNNLKREISLSDLLPEGFGPAQMGNHAAP